MRGASARVSGAQPGVVSCLRSRRGVHAPAPGRRPVPSAGRRNTGTNAGGPLPVAGYPMLGARCRAPGVRPVPKPGRWSGCPCACWVLW